MSNPLYQHINENFNWENDCIEEHEETWTELTADSPNSVNLDKTANQRNSEITRAASTEGEKTQSADSSDRNSANVNKTANQRNSEMIKSAASAEDEKTQSADSS